MNGRMDEPEDLAAIAALPPGDPRRAAFESRPAARARLRAYEAFMAADAGATPEQRADAEARLGALLERELDVPVAGAAPGAPPTRRAGSAWLAWLAGPGLRPLLATAAAIAVVVVGAGLERRFRDANEPVFRNEGALPGPGAWDARLVAEPLAAGGARLGWNVAPDADAYDVVFLSADLAEIARVEGLVEPGLALAPGARPAGLVSGAEVLWRVVARHGADDVAVSETRPLVVP